MSANEDDHARLIKTLEDRGYAEVRLSLESNPAAWGSSRPDVLSWVAAKEAERISLDNDRQIAVARKARRIEIEARVRDIIAITIAIISMIIALSSAPFFQSFLGRIYHALRP